MVDHETNKSAAETGNGTTGIQQAPEQLFDFAFCKKLSKRNPNDNKEFSDFVADLAGLAEPEYWGSRNTILSNYIHHLFSKIAADYNRNPDQEAGLYVEAGQACFNTGLYTENYEDIYCLFEPNRHSNAQPWKLRGFYKESANELSKLPFLPAKARLYDDPAMLVYDHRLAIRTNLDHILEDDENVARLPETMRDPSVKPQTRRTLEGAIREAERRVASNYTLAVPQYYRGAIQLLLPLCLTGNEPELALAIQHKGRYYMARTCLTIDMAYNNARLLVKPDTPWIRPHQAKRNTGAAPGRPEGEKL